MMLCVLNTHQEGIKSCSIDLTYLTAGKQRFFRWQTPLFTLFTIVSLCLSKFTLSKKCMITFQDYFVALPKHLQSWQKCLHLTYIFYQVNAHHFFQLQASHKLLWNLAQRIKFKGRPVGQLRYLTMTMTLEKSLIAIATACWRLAKTTSLLRSGQVLKNCLTVELDHCGCAGH